MSRDEMKKRLGAWEEGPVAKTLSRFPERKERVLNLLRQASGGRHYDSRYGVRQTGRGAYADMLGARFAKACRRLGLAATEYQQPLDCGQFQRPGQKQLGLDF